MSGTSLKKCARCAAMLALVCAAQASGAMAGGVQGRVALRQGDAWTGLSGVTLRLFQGSRMLARARTDAEGAYRLEADGSGECRLQITLPEEAFFLDDGAVSLVSADDRQGWMGPVTLPSEGTTSLADIRAAQACSVSGCAWEDADADGRLDADEGRLEGVWVVLLDRSADARAVASARTDREGGYAFRRLRPGVYSLAFQLPDGMLFTRKGEGKDESCASAAPGEVALSGTFALGEGETLVGMRIGAYAPAQIGDTVWQDLNGNGLQDYGEPPIAGAHVQLLDEHAAILAEQESDAYGYYRFSGLRPGRYRLRCLLPEGLALTRRVTGLDEIDSDADPATGTTDELRLSPGEHRRNLDFGGTK